MCHALGVCKTNAHESDRNAAAHVEERQFTFWSGLGISLVFCNTWGHFACQQAILELMDSEEVGKFQWLASTLNLDFWT